MKTKILLIIASFILLSGCFQKPERPQPDFYKNLYTDEILNETELLEFMQKLHLSYIDTTKSKEEQSAIAEQIQIRRMIYPSYYSNSSIIQPFKYEVKIGDEYIVRINSYEKTGTKVDQKIFQTISGETVQIGGKQDKPTLINLWFVHCPGCVAEMPALNRLQEKYADRVNFVSMTFESQKNIENFTKKREFNFKHIADVNDYIKEIGTKPYPESIFIDRHGYIKYIEGPLSGNIDPEIAMKPFERLLDNLLME